jgi:hypothetical protein
MPALDFNPAPKKDVEVATPVEQTVAVKPAAPAPKL